LTPCICQFSKTLLAKSNYGWTEGVLENHLLPVFGGFCLRELSTLNIQMYLAGLDPTKLDHESRDKVRVVMSASLRFAVEHGLIPANPAAKLPLKR
jgi:hypothetical protein